MVRLRDSWRFSLSAFPIPENPCRLHQPEFVSLLRWRSGGLEHPHDTPPHPSRRHLGLMRSRTFLLAVSLLASTAALAAASGTKLLDRNSEPCRELQPYLESAR